MKRIAVGDYVYDQVDPRHIGKVQLIVSGKAQIQWCRHRTTYNTWRGLLSVVAVASLIRHDRPSKDAPVEIIA